VRPWLAERRWIVALLAGGLVLRLVLAALPGFPSDIGLFKDWAQSISAAGPGTFFDDGNPAKDYAPGYLYVLWLLGDLDSIFHFSDGQWEYVLKLPPIAADLASAALLYVLLRDHGERLRLASTALYLALPPALLIGAIWGQVDSFLAFFVLLAIYFLAENRPVAASLAFAVGFLVKPQILAALPFLAYWLMRDTSPRTWLRAAGLFTLVVLAVSWPFFPSLLPWRPLHDLALHLQDSVERYQFNSVFADNLWEALGIPIDCDVEVCSDGRTGDEYLGLTTQTWGIALYVLSSAAIIVMLRRARSTAMLALGTSLCLLAAFVLLTRMHERYLFPFFLPFLAACVLLRSGVLWRAFAILATVHLLNLYDVYMTFGDLRIAAVHEWLESPDLWGTGLSTAQALSIVVCATFAALLVEIRRLARASPG
jgi:dolichyl-phosphate-mannose-protein mannosyltransferase